MYRGIYIVWRSVSEDQETLAKMSTSFFGPNCHAHFKNAPKEHKRVFLYLYSFKKKHAHQFVDLEG